MRPFLIAHTLFLLFAGSSPGESSLVHSRADLLRGVELDRFVDFQKRSDRWSDGVWSDGALLLSSPVGGGWRAAATSWEGGEVFALEVEARHDAGPYEAEYGLLLFYRAGADGIRVLFANDGRVRVDRLRPGAEEVLAPWTVCGRLHSGEWNRLGLRVAGTTLAVTVAGAEALVAEIPPLERGDVGFTVGGEGAFLFDNLALYAEGAAAEENAPPLGLPLFLEGFAVGRGEWDRGLFPVRDGSLHLAPVEGRREFDRLRFPLPERGRLQIDFRFAEEGPFDLLLPAAGGEVGLAGYLWRIDRAGRCGLYEKSASAETGVRPLSTASLFAPDGWNRLALAWEEGAFRLRVNGEEQIAHGASDRPEGGLALQSPAEGAVMIDHLLLFDAGGASPFDTAAAVEVWAEAESLAAERAYATRTDRLRDLFLTAPSLPGALDLLYRDAARAGDSETALAAAEAILGEAGYGAEEEKLRIMGLLFCRRWEEAHAALARFRSRHPEDPFALENILLLLDRTGRYDRLLREYAAAKAGMEPLRATAHAVAAWAYLQKLMPGQAADALRLARRLGPGRLDLDLLEGDLLRARGDLSGAASRYTELLEAGAPPVEDEKMQARLALLHFEMAEYGEAARLFAQLPAAADSGVARARAILRAVSLYQSGLAEGSEGRRLLEEADAIVQEWTGDPPTREDALLYDLLGRIGAALALIDLEEGESYPVYREKMRRALALFGEAAALDPTMTRTEVAEGSLPDLDPGPFRVLLGKALPDDHPVGGFVENPRRWPSWYLADRRADLADAKIRRVLGGAPEGAGR